VWPVHPPFEARDAQEAGDEAPADGGNGQQDSVPIRATDLLAEGGPSEGRHVGRLPSGDALITIDKFGDFTFDSGAVPTLRPDIFQPGHYSLFDVLAYLGGGERIELDYHFDREADTHVIDPMNGELRWWPQAYYSAGWPEASVFRLDHSIPTSRAPRSDSEGATTRTSTASMSPSGRR
jgi:hypothetical protein